MNARVLYNMHKPLKSLMLGICIETSRERSDGVDDDYHKIMSKP